MVKVLELMLFIHLGRSLSGGRAKLQRKIETETIWKGSKFEVKQLGVENGFSQHKRILKWPQILFVLFCFLFFCLFSATCEGWGKNACQDVSFLTYKVLMQ